MEIMSFTHRIFEAIILVDVASAGDQLNAIAETHSSPLCLNQFRHSDAVHLPCLIVLVNNCLFTETQASIILDTECVTLILCILICVLYMGGVTKFGLF